MKSFCQLFLVVLLALMTSAQASQILLPGETSGPSKTCWIWLVPPATLQRATSAFLGEVVLGLSKLKGLEAPALAATTTLESIERGHIQIELAESQKNAFKFELDTKGRILKIRLQDEAAKRLVGALHSDPARLLSGPAFVLDLPLMKAWLEELATVSIATRPDRNAWDEHQTRELWLHLAEHGKEPKPNPRATAEALWPRVEAAQAQDALAEIAQHFGLPTLLNTRLSRDLAEAYLRAEDFRPVFLELGARAALLLRARELAQFGKLKRIDKEHMLLTREREFGEIYALLARELGTSLILRTNP